MNPAETMTLNSRRTGINLSGARAGDISLAFLLLLFALGNFWRAFEDRGIDSWMNTGDRLASVLVLCVGAVLFLIRRPAKGRAEGIFPRIIAIAGTWMIMPAISMPQTWNAEWYLGFSAVGLTLGSGFVIWSLLTLRRNFSIFPEARSLVRTGPYGIVRHPLYATYAWMYVLMLVSRISVLAVVVTGVAIGCEVWRAHYEERVLRKAFPDYDEYASVTPRFIPKFLTPFR
jgi:protein-S-isoprenylcysteine O-methyltransferase Ste14